MPWKETCAMKERVRFISEWEEGQWSMAELCRRAGIGRKTGYKWLKRYQEGGIEALSDQSRAPHHHPNEIGKEVIEEILRMRASYPYWGPVKLKRRLERQSPKLAWPAVSTIGEILKRHGLTVERKKRRKAPPASQPLAHAGAPNDVWCGDFKGWFRCRDHVRCDPLTITDGASRYLLRCQAVAEPNHDCVRPLFAATFRENGLPRAMRTDNGPPFASTGVGGLSELSLWWIKLGIQPDRIDPGKPQQNGRHERMHLTLQQETAQPPAANLRAQQRAFDRFRRIYNEERPHEALDLNTPAECYQVSAREYPSRIPEVVYPSDYLIRWVGPCGTFRWRNQKIFLGKVLRGEPVGFEPIDDGIWQLWFSFCPLAVFHEKKMIVQRPKRRRRQTAASRSTGNPSGSTATSGATG